MKHVVKNYSSVLAFGAHPDDLEVGAGGLLARLASEGVAVQLAVVSVPNHFDQRIAEAKRGAEILGAKHLVVFDERESRVEDIPMHELVRRFDQLIADIRPELVITHSANDLHWDHGLVHRATVSALRRTACDLFAYTSSPELNVQWRAIGGCFADITTTIDTKLGAISAHKSQLARLDLNATRDIASAVGRISGFKFAEAYEGLRVRI